MQDLEIWYRHSLVLYKHAYIQKVISLAFFVWSEFINFYVFLKILSVNYGRMKKARDSKFYMHIPRDPTCIFGKNYEPSNLHLAYFKIWLKKAEIQILIN